MGRQVQLVKDEYNELFPDEVVSVQPVHDTTKLEPLDKEYDTLSQKLWDLIGECLSTQVHAGIPNACTPV